MRVFPLTMLLGLSVTTLVLAERPVGDPLISNLVRSQVPGAVKPVKFVGGAGRAGNFALIQTEANGGRALVRADGSVLPTAD